MKIVWQSVAPWVASGYGQQTDQVTRRLRAAGHDVAISAIFGLEGNMRDIDGFKCYPTDISRYGKHMLKTWVDDHSDGNRDDVQVITLQDVWTWIRSRNGGPAADFDGLRMAAWVPIDHKPAPKVVCGALEAYKVTPIAMSRFGEAELRQQGFDPLYVPHGIDTNVYQPAGDPRELKERMGLDPDTFVVGMVANNTGQNPPRKSFPQVFQAFYHFHEKHPDSFLYLHTDTNGQYEGINLHELGAACGLPTGSYGHVAQDKYLAGTISREQMAGIYSIMDVLASPSMGEGFGIPIIEAQACGVPVIVTDWTSMSELCGAGWKVDGELWWDSFHASWFMSPYVGEIVLALEEAYELRGTLGVQAREFAVQYDADTVFETYWKPVLEVLDGPREVGPLPNRAMRRQAKKAKVAA